MTLMTYPLSLPEIVHGVPGRLRVRVPSLQASPDLKATLEAQVKATPAVETVRISTATDSIIVSYRPQEPDTTEAQIYQLITQITQEFFAPNLHYQPSPESLSPQETAPESNDLPNDPPNDDLTGSSDVISDSVALLNNPIESSGLTHDLDPVIDPANPVNSLVDPIVDPVDQNSVNHLVEPSIDPISVEPANNEELGDPEPVSPLPQLEPDGISEVTSEATPGGISELIAAEESPITTNERPAPPAKAPRRPNPVPRKPRNRKKPEPN